MGLSNPNPRHELAVRMAELAREIGVPRPIEQVLAEVTTAAVELMPGADLAGVLLVKKGGEFESLADTEDLAAQLDKLQHDFGEGPCAQAALQETIVPERRFAPRAVVATVRTGCHRHPR